MIGIRGLQPIHQRAQIGDQAAQVRGLGQLGPIADEKDHQVRAKLRVGFGHLVTGQRHHRLDGPFQDADGGVLDPENHRHDGPPPPRKEVAAIGTCEKLRNRPGIHRQTLYNPFSPTQALNTGSSAAAP